MRDDVVLRDYRVEDTEQVFELMSEIYDEAVMDNSRRHWTWQYFDNPKNRNGKPAIRVIERRGEIVAMICGISQEFWLDGRVSWGLWIVDFMARQAGTEKKERLRFGQRLAFEARDTHPLIAGVNRPALNRYWKRVLGDHVDIVAAPMMIRPLSYRRLAKEKFGNPLIASAAGIGAAVAMPLVFRERRPSISSEHRLDAVERFDDDVDEFWGRAAATFSHLAVRDASYLNWRYADIPDRTYNRFVLRRDGRTAGWIVTRTLSGGNLMKGRIVDLLACREDFEAWYLLLSGVTDRFREAGADLVHGLGSPVEPLMRAYRAAGFKANPEHSRESQYIAYNRIEDLDQDAFYNGDNWYVTLGDSDTDFATPE